MPRAVKVVAVQEGRVDADVLLGLGAAAGRPRPAPSHHDALDGAHEHDDFESFVVSVPEIGDPADLLARLQAVAETHDVLRIKGFVSVTDKPLRLVVQGARFRSTFDRPWPNGAARQGHIVVIGERGLDRAAIEADILGCHLLVRETRELDEAEDAVDLGQSRADLVFLSFPTATSAHSPLPGPRKGKWLRRPPRQSRAAAPSDVCRSLCRAGGRRRAAS